MFISFLKKHDLNEYSFSSELFPTIDNRNFWNDFQNDTCVGIAEAEINYGWPIIKATDFMEFKKSGNRTIMEKIHFDRRNHLVLFALAELKENKGRFIPALVNGLFTICEESFWGLSAHYLMDVENIPSPEHPYIDLFAAETAEHLALIITLLRRPLFDFCPEIIDRVEYELDRRIMTPYESRYDSWWMGYRRNTINNWNPWILSNVLTVFLLSECSQRRKRQAIKKMLSEIQYYYNSLPEDGGCDEGPGYWGRAGASLFEFIYQLKCATNGALNFFDDAKIGRIADYLKKVHITADIFVNVADAHADGKGNLAVLLYGFAKETNQKELMNFSAAVYREKTSTASPLNHTNRTIRRLIYSSVFLHEMEDFETTYPLHGTLEYMPDLELAVLRRGDLILSVKGGFNNESHNHNDVGSFTLYDGRTPVLVDIGISTYTRFTLDGSTTYVMIPWTRGSYHNIPMINGTEQPAGRMYRADRFEASEDGICISYPNAYPKDALISGLNRSLELTDSTLLITDCFDFIDEGKQNFCEVLMSVLPVSVENNVATIDGRYTISSSTGVLQCERVPFEDANLERDWKTDACYRLMLKCSGEKEISIKVEKI